MSLILIGLSLGDPIAWQVDYRLDFRPCTGHYLHNTHSPGLQPWTQVWGALGVGEHLCLSKFLETAWVMCRRGLPSFPDLLLSGGDQDRSTSHLEIWHKG